jgi:hypothetical protein
MSVPGQRSDGHPFSTNTQSQHQQAGRSGLTPTGQLGRQRNARLRPRLTRTPLRVGLDSTTTASGRRGGVELQTPDSRVERRRHRSRQLRRSLRRCRDRDRDHRRVRRGRPVERVRAGNHRRDLQIDPGRTARVRGLADRQHRRRRGHRDRQPRRRETRGVRTAGGLSRATRAGRSRRPGPAGGCTRRTAPGRSPIGTAAVDCPRLSPAQLRALRVRLSGTTGLDRDQPASVQPLFRKVVYWSDGCPHGLYRGEADGRAQALGSGLGKV